MPASGPASTKKIKNLYKIRKEGRVGGYRFLFQYPKINCLVTKVLPSRQTEVWFSFLSLRQGG